MVFQSAEDPGVLRVTREHPPRPVTEMWAWIVTEANGGEGVAACEMTLDGQRFMMPLVGADEERVRSLEPQARFVAQRTGLQVALRRFGGNGDLTAALSAAIGYMENAAIDLQTGAPKATALATLRGGIERARAAVARAEGP